jgi:hypothetical protein
LPGYVVTREPSFFVVLPSCPRGSGDPDPRELFEERGLFEELEQLSVSPMSVAPPMLSLFRPMLSPGHPIPFSVERVVVQQLNLVFGTSKQAQKESVRIEQEFFSCHL